MTNDNKPKVTGSRRRRGTSDGDRERASASQRERPSQSSQPRNTQPSTSGGSRSTSSSTSSILNLLLNLILRSKRPGLTILILAVVGICVFTVFSMAGGGLNLLPTDDGTYYTPPANSDSAATATPYVAKATATPKDSSGPIVSVDGQKWLIMLYQDADDQILEQDIYMDLNEAEKVGSSARVEIVAQIDRYAAGYSGDGNWDSTKRYYVTQDPDLNVVRSRQVADLGEQSMADGQTLVDFVTWATETYEADKYVLIMSDHGMGWPGGWSDKNPPGSPPSDIPLSQYMGDTLYLREIDAALQQIRDETVIDQFELIGMDACLMGHLEVYTALAPHARYAVASQETEPAVGWAYTAFLGALKSNPDINGAELGRLIVDSYIDDDQRIVDDNARAEMLSKGRPLGGLFGYTIASADQVAAQMSQNTTLAVIDLSEIPAVLEALDDFAIHMQVEDQSAIAEARTYAQSFTSVFGSKVPPSYIDLGHFTQLVRRQNVTSGTATAAEALLYAIDKAVLEEKHGSKKTGATGLSIYFPTSQLIRTAAAGPQSYTVVARRFAETSLWDDFLVFHYTGREFDQVNRTVAVPEQGTAIRGPGTSTLSASDLILSETSVTFDDFVLMSSDIAGDNIGYIYLFVGYVDQASNSIQLIDADYIESRDTQEQSGVYYPVWPESEFNLEFRWEPIVFAINNGEDQVVARFKPESYGKTWEEATYSVEGTYTFAENGAQLYAKLYFTNGILTQVYGFNGTDDTGAPREITPQFGDSFTVLDTWWDLDSTGNIDSVAKQASGTLTFGEQAWEWKDLYAPAGVYVLGYIIEDMDGNQYPVYTSITVK